MENQIINGDCISVLKEMPDESIDLSVFSPPYDAIRTYQGAWAFDPLSLGIELYRVTKEGGMSVVVINDGTKDFAKSLTTFRLAVNWCDNANWKLFETCIYYRQGRPGAWWSKRFRVDHEYILIFLKGKRPKHFDKSHLSVPLTAKWPKRKVAGTQRRTDGSLSERKVWSNNDVKCRGTIWEYGASCTENNREKLLHPATFPDKLVSDVIRCFSKEGDLVLDPFVGSGTTACMAKLYNRKYIGIDISEDYCKLSESRISKVIQL